MAKSKALYQYSFRFVAVTIGMTRGAASGGFSDQLMSRGNVTGLWEGDDAVSIRPYADIAVPLVGVDGAAIVSYSTAEAVEITIRLMPTSPWHQYLTERFKSLQAGVFSPMSISIRNTGGGGTDGVGEGGNSAAATIIRGPDYGFGATANSRDWVFFAQAWDWNRVSNPNLGGEGQVAGVGGN